MDDLETLRKHLGQNLRRARAQAGLSQREVAQLYGCPMEDFLR